MSSPEAAAPAVEGAHSVFMVTNFWETMSDKVEIAQGKAVTDASKAAGVQHLIFSSLINVADASKGRLSHVTHFDGKAKIEQYIRASGIRATFVQPGLFMSGFFSFFKKQDDGSLAWAMPDGVKADQAKLPLFDAAADTGEHCPPIPNQTLRCGTEQETNPRVLQASLSRRLSRNPPTAR
jgi:uncharacterized protein YbjT (DUF2867 family)